MRPAMRPDDRGRPAGAIDVLVAKASADPAFRELLLEGRFRAAREAGLALRLRDFEELAAVPRWELEALVARTKADPGFRSALLRGAAGFLVAALGFGGPVWAGDGPGTGPSAPPDRGAPAVVREAGDCSPGDADDDGLPDSWEEQHFGSADLYTGADDPDGDDFSNRVEYLWYTDPDDITSVPASDPDLDKDGLPDDWEERHFGSIPLYGADDDPDGDTYTNFEEYYWDSDPDDPLSWPNVPRPLYGPAYAYGCIAACQGTGAGAFGLVFGWLCGFFAWLRPRK